MQRSMATSLSNVYQFQISLKNIKPRIWRRVQVPENYTFRDLHEAIQNAMGWNDCHLHHFLMVNPQTGQKEYIGVPDNDFSDDKIIPETEVLISQYFLSPKAKAMYEYDFGDSWEHQVTLEKILPAAAGTQYPQCIAGKRACPPEDCGGFYGYEELLKIIADPSHGEHNERMEWLDDIGRSNFDPEEFNPQSVVFW